MRSHSLETSQPGRMGIQHDLLWIYGEPVRLGSEWKISGRLGRHRRLMTAKCEEIWSWPEMMVGFGVSSKSPYFRLVDNSHLSKVKVHIYIYIYNLLMKRPWICCVQECWWFSSHFTDHPLINMFFDCVGQNLRPLKFTAHFFGFLDVDFHPENASPMSWPSPHSIVGGFLGSIVLW